MYLVFVVIALLMPIPLYFGFKSRLNDKHRRKSLVAVKDGFKRLIKRHNLSISDSEVYTDRLIAMDRKANKLILVVYKNGITWEKCFGMDELIFCQIVNVTNKVSGCTEGLRMELRFRIDTGIVNFMFFDDRTDDLRDLPSRIKKSKYWKRKIQYQMSFSQIGNTLQRVT